MLESGKDLPREWWEDWGRETVRRLVEKADCFVGYDREYSVTEYIRDLGKYSGMYLVRSVGEDS